MKVKKLILSLLTIFAILLGFVAIAPTTVKNDENGFSAVNALKHLQTITLKPHSVYDYENHEEVRQYLLKTSKELVGEDNVFERNYLTEKNQNPTDGITYVDNSIELTTRYNVNTEYDIRNILVQIPGKNTMGLLLVAHYDSRGHVGRFGELGRSYGASDDGYGVTTLLEIMRYFQNKKDSLENSIYFLFADAEEVSMGGSTLESHNEELMNKVNFVINVEGRGVAGASYMFETSKNNNKVIDLYQKAADKVSYSVAPAVYSVMTNYTDFASFTAVGKQGLNFSTLDNIDNYHNPSDNYGNVNASSIQHYGAQIVPIVNEYVSNSEYGSSLDYFKGTHDMIFFNTLPNVFVIYSATFGIILAILILVAVIAFIVLKVVKKDFQVKTFLKQLLILVAFLVLSILLGYIVSAIIARLVGLPWSLSNIRCPGSKWIFTIFMIALLIFINYLYTKINKNNNNRYFLLASVVLNALLNVATAFTLSGASFMFMIPALLGIVYLFIEKYVSKKLVKEIVVYVSLFVLALIFIPLIYSLFLALTLGGLLAFAMLVYLPYSTLLPMIKKLLK